MSPRRSPAREGVDDPNDATQGAGADEPTAAASAGAGDAKTPNDPPQATTASTSTRRPASDEDDEVGRLDKEIIDKVLPERVRIALKLQPAQVELIAEACYVFGINPDPALKPRELAAHRIDQGEPDGTPPVPASVVLVTAGGLKIRYPIDDDTDTRLHIVYNAFRVNKDTGDREMLPLPGDLTLPRENVDGIVRAQEHVYRSGYLKEGGAAERERRAKIAELRNAGKLR
jgi:HAMP domain-containing protein